MTVARFLPLQLQLSPDHLLHHRDYFGGAMRNRHGLSEKNARPSTLSSNLISKGCYRHQACSCTHAAGAESRLSLALKFWGCRKSASPGAGLKNPSRPFEVSTYGAGVKRIFTR